MIDNDNERVRMSQPVQHEEVAQPAMEFAFRAIQEDNERLRRVAQAAEDRATYLAAMLYQEQAVGARNESTRKAQIEALVEEVQQLRQAAQNGPQSHPDPHQEAQPNPTTNGALTAAGSQD